MTLVLDQNSLGFQHSDFDWNKYMKCRPVYPPSSYARIYNHHSAARPDNAFHTVHDAGAGAGIASERLAERFTHVIVSEPNTEYIQMAEKRLSSLPRQFPTDKFTYRNERAEKSGIRNKSVDCVTICEAIHWADIPAAMAEFARQLKSGGTLSIIHYSTPRIVDHEKAQESWDRLFTRLSNRLLTAPEKGVHRRAIRQISTGYDNLGFDENVWEQGVERLFTNTNGDRRELTLTKSVTVEEGEDRVGMNDRRTFIEDDPDWETEGCDLEWFRNLFMSFMPDEDLKHEWRLMEEALGGKSTKVKVTWPNVQLIATRK